MAARGKLLEGAAADVLLIGQSPLLVVAAQPQNRRPGEAADKPMRKAQHGAPQVAKSGVANTSREWKSAIGLVPGLLPGRARVERRLIP